MLLHESLRSPGLAKHERRPQVGRLVLLAFKIPAARLLPRRAVRPRALLGRGDAHRVQADGREEVTASPATATTSRRARRSAETGRSARDRGRPASDAAARGRAGRQGTVDGAGEHVADDVCSVFAGGDFSFNVSVFQTNI